MSILVVGCGSIGKRHLRNLRALGQSDLIVYRSRHQGVEAIEQEFGVRSFFDLSSALAQVQAVVIANPTSLHVQVALEAAHAGCDLFIEKPVSHSLDGLDELLKVVATKKLVVAVGYHLRFHPALKRVKELLDAGIIGAVYGCRAWVGQYLANWHPLEDYRSSYMASRELGGGVVLNLSHELDYLRWLFGDVRAVTAWAGQPSPLELETESWAEIALEFQSGVCAQVHLDCLRRTPARGLEITGGDGTVVCNLAKSEIGVYVPGASEAQKQVVPLPDSNQPYLDEMSQFLQCISERTVPMNTLDDGIATLRVALAGLEAARTGVRQRLDA